LLALAVSEALYWFCSDGLGSDARIQLRGTAEFATLDALAPGVSAALVTTVAGLLVAIPSMFGYNWLVHNLRVMTVELDNFAQELVSHLETQFLPEDEDEWAAKSD